MDQGDTSRLCLRGDAPGSHHLFRERILVGLEMQILTIDLRRGCVAGVTSHPVPLITSKDPSSSGEWYPSTLVRDLADTTTDTGSSHSVDTLEPMQIWDGHGTDVLMANTVLRLR